MLNFGFSRLVISLKELSNQTYKILVKKLTIKPLQTKPYRFLHQLVLLQVNITGRCNLKQRHFWETYRLIEQLASSRAIL